MTEIAEGLGNIALRYENEPYIRALAQLIPCGIGSASDAYLSVKAKQIRESRLRTFFDELAKNHILLTKEVVETDDFLHCFFIATGAVTKAHREEKIHRFARLLKSSVRERGPRNTDDFEELIGALDDLSETE
jgi:hypothetical protein